MSHLTLMLNTLCEDVKLSHHLALWSTVESATNATRRLTGTQQARQGARRASCETLSQQAPQSRASPENM
jgi:hypothetical protein